MKPQFESFYEEEDIRPGDPRYISFEDAEQLCDHRSIGSKGYRCTLFHEHKGPHVAHGPTGLIFARWLP